MDKNILFYSNFCTHSKKLLEDITKSKMKDSLLFICIDDKNIQLPNFIRVVPTVYLVKNKSILTDSKISEWLKLNSNNNSEDDILAFNNSKGMSSSFSFLNDGDENIYSNKYTFITNDSSIETPKEFNANNSVKDDLTKDFERLQSSRDTDFSKPIRRI